MSDVRAVFQLVGECRELGGSPDRWRGRLLEVLPRLVGGPIAMVGEFDHSGPRPWPISAVDAGWPTERDRRFWLNWCRRPEMPEHPGLAAMADRPQGTYTRQQLVRNTDWDRSPHVNEVLRPAGMDEGIVSVHPLTGQLRHTVTVVRVAGERRFGRRERNLLHLLHTELAPYLGQSLAVSTNQTVRLTPRQQQVLEHLLDGAPEKRIARQLGVTPATLHAHVKQIYPAFGVSSRAELMAHFLRHYRRPNG